MPTETANEDLPKRQRRWFQFSLRTLLIGITLLAAASVYVGFPPRSRLTSLLIPIC
jgi:hypothetical protein